MNSTALARDRALAFTDDRDQLVGRHVMAGTEDDKSGDRLTPLVVGKPSSSQVAMSPVCTHPLTIVSAVSSGWFQ